MISASQRGGGAAGVQGRWAATEQVPGPGAFIKRLSAGCRAVIAA
jgi:hypothetical protein